VIAVHSGTDWALTKSVIRDVPSVSRTPACCARSVQEMSEIAARLTETVEGDYDDRSACGRGEDSEDRGVDN
jgi:hypothetical protein